MPLDQFGALLGLLPQIEGVLAGKGHVLPRPQYGGEVDMEVDMEGGDGNGDEGGGDREAKGKKVKENYEETSDEG